MYCFYLDKRYSIAISVKLVFTLHTTHPSWSLKSSSKSSIPIVLDDDKSVKVDFVTEVCTYIHRYIVYYILIFVQAKKLGQDYAIFDYMHMIKRATVTNNYRPLFHKHNAVGIDHSRIKIFLMNLTKWMWRRFLKKWTFCLPF